MADLTKILLLDDESKYLNGVLPLYGYDVVFSPSLGNINALYEFDLVLLDIYNKNFNGLELIKSIRKNQISKDIPLIVISKDNKKMIQALDFGADDYIIKPVVIPNLLARIKAVLRRSNRCSKTIDNNVTIGQINKINSLTKREKDVLLLVTQGETNKSIAQKLVLSEITVKSHLNNIFKKLNVKNRSQALLIAMQMDLLVEN